MTLLHRLAAALGALAFAGGAPAGEIPGVTAEYFHYSGSDTPTFPSTAALQRTESTIDVSASTASPAPGINADRYLARYTGEILVPATGAYTFNVTADDGVRLYVDCSRDGSFGASDLLINHWVDQGPTAYSASCPGNLAAGLRYKFRLEYYDRTGAATIQLKWSGPSPVGSTLVTIPRGNGTQGLMTGITDTTPPTIASASMACNSNTLLYVVFSEEVDSSTAQAIGNYSLNHGDTVSAAVLQSDSRTVALTVSPITSTAQLSISNVADLAGNAIVAGSTVSVSPTTRFANGLKGTYYDQNGTPGAFFTGTAVTRIDGPIDFEWGSGVPVSGVGSDNFSVRWQGLLRLYTSGLYYFKTRSDDGVRLVVNGTTMIDNWLDHSATYDISASIYLQAGTYVPIVLEYYDRTNDASLWLGWRLPGVGVFATIPANNLYYCATDPLAGFSIAVDNTSGSTCTPSTVTISAVNSAGNILSQYANTLSLSTSTGRGDWTAGSSPAPAGVLGNGTSNDGAASYAFTTADAGVVKLKLGETLAQNVVITASDPDVSGSASTSATIAFRDNAFTLAEDAAARVAGTDVAVAGRPHDHTVSLIRKDPSTGSCGIAADYTGSRALKLWRTDSGGSWTAPTVVSPALTIPSSKPASDNLTLAFANGVANFNLGTTDIGRYTLNLLDDSLAYADTPVSGTGNTLTVRPFGIVVQGIKQVVGGATTPNPGGSAATDTVFAKAGSNFQATVSAYRWASGADSNNDGTPDAAASLAATTAGGVTPSFSSTVSLSPLAGSQTPSGGTLGALNNGNVGTASGTGTTSSLQYTEVGSFALDTSGVVSNFLGSGLSLDAVVFNSSGSPSTRVGRFIPSSFAVSGATVTHRANAGCTPASTFTYLDENFSLGFTLTAKNAGGAVTTNYTGSFARLDLADPSIFNLAGISGSTVFRTGTSPRLSLGTSSGTWSAGIANGIALTAAALRGNGPEAELSASFGIRPVDLDGVQVGSYDLDTDSPADGNDRSALGSVTLRFGRLRLQNAIGSQDRTLALPVAAQYWNGSAFATNTLDSCTKILASEVNFGNHRKTLTVADTVLAGSPVTLASGAGSLVLAKPATGHAGTVDVALSLGSNATDNACQQPWTPTGAATAGANRPYLRGAWCGSSHDRDPSARASFGLYRGADNFIHQRENP